MKKLIAMIGAVATAFGLYATDPTPFATSFESRDAGISTTEAGATIFTPGEGWENTTDEATFPVKAYEDGETLPYTASGTPMARRDGSFACEGDNDQYLKLSTGTNSLTRAVGEGNKFLDQLVKFTGFEDPQTNLVNGVKIAVWMSEYVTNEVENVEYTETNLYVTCAKVGGGKVEQVALKIAGDYKLDKWYRLTIKTLDSIYDATKLDSDVDRAGFIVYIDGVQVAAESDEAAALIQYGSEMTDVARNFMAEKKLFPAISTTDVAFNKAGFSGMGGVDDIIIDNEGPIFAQTIEIAETAFGLDPEKVEVDSVTVGGETIAKTDGKYIVKPGDTVVVNFKALDGYFINPTSKTFENVSKTTDFDVSEEIEVTEAAVMATINDTDVRYYLDLNSAYAELSTVIGHDDSVVIEILSQTALIDENENIVYELNQGAQVTIVPAGDEDYPAGAYLVSIADYEEGEEEEVETIPGTATDNLGAMPGKTMIVEFSGEGELAGRAFNLQGNIYGYGEDETLIDVAGETVLAGALTIGAACDGASTGDCGATLKTDALDLNSSKITLRGKGKVMVKTALTVADAFTNAAKDIKVTEPTDDDYYTYTLKAGVEFTITTPANATITDVDGAELVEDDTYTAEDGATVTVTLTADNGYLFDNKTNTKEFTYTAAQGETFAPTAPTAAPVKKGLLFFLTLQEAVDAEGDDAIKILDDIALDARVTITGKIIDLEADEPVTISCASAGVFKLINGADVTIGKNVTLTSAANPTVFVIGSDLTINGVVQNTNPTYDKAFAVCGSGNDTEVGCNIVVNGKVENAMDAGIYFPCAGTLVVNGEVKGYTAIIIKNGELTVNKDAVIIATGTDFKRFPKNTNGAQSTGDAIVAGYYGAIDAYGTPKVSILGGTITVADAVKDQAVGVQGYDSDERKAPDDAKSNIAVEGGTFNAPVLEGYCANGFIPKDNGDGTYGVKVGEYVARVNGEQGYETLAEALTAAQAGDTVNLITDIALDNTLTIDKAITFDLGDNELSLAPNAMVGINVMAAATIQNGDITSTRTAYGTAYAILNGAVAATYKNLTVDATNYKFGLTCDSDDSDLVAACTGTPTVTVNCQNVDITGNGTFFYAQGTLLNLDANCSGIVKTDVEGQGYAAAVYSALNATITIAGGTYTHDYSLISGNFGGKIVVNGGAFTGDIKSYMKAGIAGREALEKLAGYKASFTFNAGEFDGDIVFEDAAAESRALDFFKKDLDETVVIGLEAPAGYKWGDDGVLVAIPAGPFGGGSGTELDPYIISEYDHLVELQTKVAAGDTFAGKFFKQNATIDFTGKDPWDGIGTKASTTVCFSGIYDGYNNAITGVKLSGKNTYQGFFNSVNNATIKNLTINMAGFKDGLTGEFGGAAFCGYAHNDSHIINCKATGFLGTTDHPATHNLAGFIVNWMGANVHGAYYPTIENCVNEMALVGNGTKIGGFIAISNVAGGNIGNGMLKVIDSVNTATITALAGGEGSTNYGYYSQFLAYSTNCSITFEDCVAAGSVVVGDGFGEKPYGAGSFAGIHHNTPNLIATGCIARDNALTIGIEGTQFGSTGLTFGIPSTDETYGDGYVALVDEDDLVLDGTVTYKVMADGAALELDAGESITLNETLKTAEITTVAGYIVDKTGNTYTSKALPTFAVNTTAVGATAVVTVKVNDEDVTENIPATLDVDDTYKVTSVAAENYTYEGVTLDTGWTLSDDKKTITIEGTAAAEQTISITVPAAVEASSDPIPPKKPADEKEVEDILSKLPDADALKAIIKTPDQYDAFQTWAHQVTGGSEAVAKSMKAAVSFQLSSIVDGAKLFTNEPAVKFTAIAQNGTDWNATMELKDGDVEVQLAEAEAAYAQFVKVGTVVTDITQAATIKGAVNAEEKIVLTITPPEGDAGFIKFTTAK